MKVRRSSSSRKPEDLIQSIQEKGAASKIQSAAQLTGGYTLWRWKSLAPYCRSDAGFQALRPHMLELQSPSESQSPCWRQRDKIGAKLKQFNVETGTEPTVEADGSDGFPQSSWERNNVGKVSHLWFLFVEVITSFVYRLNTRCCHTGIELTTSRYVKSEPRACFPYSIEFCMYKQDEALALLILCINEARSDARRY